MIMTMYLSSKKHRARLARWSQVTGHKWDIDRLEEIVAEIPSDVRQRIAFVLDKSDTNVRMHRRGDRSEGRFLVLVTEGFPHSLFFANRLDKEKLDVQAIVLLC